MYLLVCDLGPPQSCHLIKVFIAVFLRFEQTIDYKMKFRGESTIVADNNESGLSFSEEEMKTQLFTWKHI